MQDIVLFVLNTLFRAVPARLASPREGLDKTLFLIQNQWIIFISIICVSVRNHGLRAFMILLMYEGNIYWCFSASRHRGFCC